MFAVILVTGAHAFGFVVAAFAAGVAVGYGFRGKEHAAIQAVGADVAKTGGVLSAEVKKL
jgi:hypothetical protein